MKRFNIRKIFFNNITGGSAPGAGVTAYVGPTGGAWKQLGLRFLTNDGTNGLLNRMIINHLGNVGIGTNSPGSLLDVKGTLRLSGSNSGYVGFAPATDAGSTTYTLPAVLS